MKIRTKIAIAICIISIILISILCAAISKITAQKFSALEEKETQINLERALNALSREIEQLGQSNRDWGRWDDTYNYIANKNIEYEKTNLNIGSFEILRVNEVVYMSNSGEVVFAKKYNHMTSTEEKLNENDLLFYNKLVKTENKTLTGIALKNGQLLIFSKAPITMGSAPSEPNGTLFFSRYLDENQIEKLKEIAQLEIKIYLATELLLENSKNIKEFHTENSLARDNKIFIYPLNQKNIKAYCILGDFQNNPIAIFEITFPREIAKQGKETSCYLLVSIIIAGLMFGFFMFFVVERIVVSRILKLSYEIEKIDEKTKKFLTKDNANDEISNLYNSINKMLNRIEQSKQEVKKSSKQLEQEKQNLQKKVKELEKFQSLTSDRELKMIELKKKIAELKKQEVRNEQKQTKNKIL